MKRRLVLAGLVLLLALGLTTAGCSRANSQTTATLTIQALNAWSAQGIPGVHIVIPEANVHVTTDASGVAQAITVPISLPEGDASALTPTWGEITVLAYCEGYIDTAMLRVALHPGENREGPNLILFPKDDNPDPIVLTEGPPQDWCQALLDSYRP